METPRMEIFRLVAESQTSKRRDVAFDYLLSALRKALPGMFECSLSWRAAMARNGAILTGSRLGIELREHSREEYRAEVLRQGLLVAPWGKNSIVCYLFASSTFVPDLFEESMFRSFVAETHDGLKATPYEQVSLARQMHEDGSIEIGRLHVSFTSSGPKGICAPIRERIVDEIAVAAGGDALYSPLGGTAPKDCLRSLERAKWEIDFANEAEIVFPKPVSLHSVCQSLRRFGPATPAELLDAQTSWAAEQLRQWSNDEIVLLQLYARVA